jgi:hypothetical protein
MSFRERDTQLYREDEKSGHKKLGPEQREELIKVGLSALHSYVPIIVCLPASPHERSLAECSAIRLKLRLLTVSARIISLLHRLDNEATAV